MLLVLGAHQTLILRVVIPGSADGIAAGASFSREFLQGVSGKVFASRIRFRLTYVQGIHASPETGPGLTDDAGFEVIRVRTFTCVCMHVRPWLEPILSSNISIMR